MKQDLINIANSKEWFNTLFRVNSKMFPLALLNNLVKEGDFIFDSHSYDSNEPLDLLKQILSGGHSFVVVLNAFETINGKVHIQCGGPLESIIEIMNDATLDKRIVRYLNTFNITLNILNSGEERKETIEHCKALEWDMGDNY